MHVTVRLHGTLRKYVPVGAVGNVVGVDVADGATVGEVIAKLGIPADYAKMMVSGDAQLEVSSVLADQQELHLFPPLAGGC